MKKVLIFFLQMFGIFSLYFISVLVIFKPKRDEVTWEWRKLHKEELNDLYSSPNTVRVIKSRRMRWAGHVALMGRGVAYTGFWWGNLRERDLLEDSGVDGLVIFRWLFRKWDGGVWTGSG
jgi:hypothetical protein